LETGKHQGASHAAAEQQGSNYHNYLHCSLQQKLLMKAQDPLFQQDSFARRS
jgi:hypothetical protein